MPRCRHVEPGELTERACEKPQLSTTDSKESNIAGSAAKETSENETVSMIASRSAVSAKRLPSAALPEQYRITREAHIKQPTAQEETGLLSRDR